MAGKGTAAASACAAMGGKASDSKPNPTNIPVAMHASHMAAADAKSMPQCHTCATISPEGPAMKLPPAQGQEDRAHTKRQQRNGCDALL